MGVCAGVRLTCSPLINFMIRRNSSNGRLRRRNGMVVAAEILEGRQLLSFTGPLASEQVAAQSSAQIIAAATTQPSVGQLTSPEGRTNAPIDTLIAVTVRLPNGGGVD